MIAERAQALGVEGLFKLGFGHTGELRPAEFFTPVVKLGEGVLALGDVVGGKALLGGLFEHLGQNQRGKPAQGHRAAGGIGGHALKEDLR